MAYSYEPTTKLLSQGAALAGPAAGRATKMVEIRRRFPRIITIPLVSDSKSLFAPLPYLASGATRHRQAPALPLLRILYTVQARDCALLPCFPHHKKVKHNPHRGLQNKAVQ